MSETVECVNCSKTFEPVEEGFSCPECDTPVTNEDIPDEENTSGGSTPTCENCGEQIPENANVCPHCGQPLDGEEEVDKPEIVCPDPDCDGKIPQGTDYCMDCGHERGEGVKSSSEGGDPESPSVTFEIEDREIQVVKEGDVVLENDEERPDNSFGMEARRALVNNGVDVDEARKVHRDHLLVEVEDGKVILEDNGKNPTKFNGDSLSKGDTRELSEGDTIELTGVATIGVNFTT